MRKAAVIGAGAAGCLGAVTLAEAVPDVRIDLFEAGAGILSKVARTGGGRCNITNTFGSVRSIKQVYPRGFRLMQRLLPRFGSEDTLRWFGERGLSFVEEDEGRVFPSTMDAMDVVNVLKESIRLCNNIIVHTASPVASIAPYPGGGYFLTVGDRSFGPYESVIVTTGGMESPRASALPLSLGLPLSTPVPSLFALETGAYAVKRLSGISARASLKFEGTSYASEGQVLITGRGFSGPAIIRLSSYAARYLAENSYKSRLLIDWLPGLGAAETAEMIGGLFRQHPSKLCVNIHPDELPSRLWAMLLNKAGFGEGQNGGSVSVKQVNRLSSTVLCDSYDISGRDRFKDEFVTCGGISLDAVKADTLESKINPSLYFAGEVLDIDGITGGFNLQAAWTTGYLAAKSAAESLSSSASTFSTTTVDRTTLPDGSIR